MQWKIYRKVINIFISYVEEKEWPPLFLLNISPLLKMLRTSRRLAKVLTLSFLTIVIQVSFITPPTFFLEFAGWGTDEKAIISILGHRNLFQRKLIRQAYQEIYHEDLLHQLKSELSGDFEV